MSAPKVQPIRTDPAETASPDRVRAIDRLGVVDSIIADYKARLAPFEAEREVLEEQLGPQYQDRDPAQPFVEEGGIYGLKVSQCAEEQQMDIPTRQKVYREIGKNAYLALAKPTFESCKTALSPQKYKALIKKLRVGKRTLKTFLKTAPAAPAKAA